MALEEKTNGKLKKTLIALVTGGIAGFAGASGFMLVAGSGFLGTLSASQEIAALVALVYLITGLGVGIGVWRPTMGARFLNVEDAEDLQEQRSMLGWATVAMLALGLALMVSALAGPAGPIAAPLALTVVGALLAVTVVAGKIQQRYTDELMQALSQQAAAAAFYVLFIVGGGWALLAHTGYVGGAAPLDWLTLFAATLLLASFGTVIARGMMQFR